MRLRLSSRRLFARLRDRDLPRQLSAFVAVGVLGTALDFGLLWLLTHFGVWIPVAVTVAYAIATITQFFLSRHWIFRATRPSAALQAGRYAAVVFANWLVALAFVQVGTALLHMAPLVAKALAIPPSAAVSFLGHRGYTFRLPRTGRE